MLDPVGLGNGRGKTPEAMRSVHGQSRASLGSGTAELASP